MRTPESTLTDPDELLRFGRVVSVDHAAGKCVVEIDEDLQTGPIRWAAPRMGETRVWCPPAVGEQVLVLCPAGEIGAAIAIGGITCNAFPLPGNSAMELVRFKDGAVLSYDPDSHDLAFVLPGNGKFSINAPAGVSITGDLDVSGSVVAAGNLDAGTGASGQFSTPDGKTITVSAGIVNNIA
ncbi:MULTISPECIES: phage baseplate assembly protein V [unclassified Novosphingobium]|uniref:phage baseplate assembly protein V n=1 Tax=unclassified Novosphingobium TaxID=2644732 RepID=UPI000D4D7F2E|nr:MULTISPECIES: phage baseplate assembly protein V [unclassified Novosphingobium]PTR08917.1 phage baseplate assembly protein V [Novosphingobium sp. GV055]PUB01829.1 phage baseplate assembly protein V [Novosphingobium sp. GV061]PUB17801.1 phage baseplate assembly protein V [Novosphingobium sp. GV079]PUB40495.1 phage baseplate assembly protein V [Novosphingobium sp. GV027]